MEGNRFTPPNIEKPSSELGGSEETKKPAKKKKSAFADRFKTTVGDKLIDDKTKESEKPETTAKSEEVENPAENEFPKDSAETDDAAEPETTEISAEENPVIDEKLKAAKIEELRDEIAATDSQVDIVAAEKAIDMLQNMPDSELVVDVEAGEEASAPEEAVESDEPEKLELPPEHADVLFGDEDEPLPFNDEADIPLTPSSTATKSGGTGGGSGGGVVPPSPPTPMNMPVPGPIPRPSFGGGSGRFNAAPVEQLNTSPNMISTADAAIYERRAAGRGLLVGGIVGYLIGRRRGRIKTERRMNVVVKKLEQQVEAKQQIIDQQVEAVKQKARQEYWANKGATSAEQTALATGSTKKAERATQPTAERFYPAGRIERQPNVRPERAETASKIAERQPSNIELRDEDIVRISETITVGATNLKKIFEARLVSPNGLRRIVNEHLQGKDIRRGLAREFMAKELSFERDPRFRDILPAELAGRRSAGGTAVANSVDLTQTLPQPIMTAGQHADAQVTKIPVKKQRRPAITTGVLAILTVIALALAAYAVLLGLTR